MHILFIALEPEAKEAADQSLAQLWRLEAEQALALMRSFSVDPGFTSLLVCRKGSRLFDEARALALPVLALGGFGGIWARLALWRWQRRHKSLLIQTIGEASLGLGANVLAMCKKGSAKLWHAFFVRPPAESVCQGRAMRATSRIFCGSEELRKLLAEIFAALPEKKRPLAELDLLAPGIPLTDYCPLPEMWPMHGAHGRYVFGMGESLEPGSGALLMVRAMAALWQREDLPPWEVRMFGQGPRFEEVLAEAKSLGVAARLAILGEQPPEVLGQCSAWVAPGSSAFELPQTLWAGVALGLPLICSQSTLHRERLAQAPAQTALRVGEDEPQALARAMIAVMRDARLRLRIAQAGESLRSSIGLEAMSARYQAFLPG